MELKIHFELFCKFFLFICNYDFMKKIYQVNKLKKLTKFNMLDPMTSLINFKNNLKFNQIK